LTSRSMMWKSENMFECNGFSFGRIFNWKNRNWITRKWQSKNLLRIFFASRKFFSQFILFSNEENKTSIVSSWSPVLMINWILFDVIFNSGLVRSSSKYLFTIFKVSLIDSSNCYSIINLEEEKKKQSWR
jgi:hypothetical protein